MTPVRGEGRATEDDKRKKRKEKRKRERERRGGSVKRRETIAIERECDKSRVLGVKKY